jgi:hypothetical protein
MILLGEILQSYFITSSKEASLLACLLPSCTTSSASGKIISLLLMENTQNGLHLLSFPGAC